MGFKPKRKTYRLKFADPDMDGLEVRTHGTSFGFIADMLELSAIRGGRMTQQDVEKFLPAFNVFVEAIIEWNLDRDDDTEWPVCIEAIRAQDPEFAFAMLYGWLDTLADVPDPLDRKSSSGDTSEVERLPMETLSESPGNWPEPNSSWELLSGSPGTR